MSESTGLCLRVLRIGALACLPLLGACAGQFAGSTHTPPRVDVPEPGNGRAAPANRAPATAQPQTSAVKVYPAPTASTAAQASAYPAAQPPQTGQALPATYPGAPAPASTMPLPGATAPASEDSFTIEAPAVAGPAGSAGGAGQIDLQAPPPSANTAVNTLLAQAATERRGGNLDAAIAAAERALRIAPADPAVYCELATLRLERGDYALAEQLARKGLSYQPDAQMQQRLNAIIERARRGKTG
ncbi:MAG TPA: tetratricopeptide repeat protein [Pseudomonadales bacterium]|nr:tetratricopeptide repeat protein [Pseudomonadales bacterium]